MQVKLVPPIGVWGQLREATGAPVQSHMVPLIQMEVIFATGDGSVTHEDSSDAEDAIRREVRLLTAEIVRLGH